jgi:hypothetical protein
LIWPFNKKSSQSLANKTIASPLNMPFPDHIDGKPKIIFFTDFDGTITTEDVCDWLVRC